MQSVQFICLMGKAALCLLTLMSLRSVTCEFFHHQSAVLLKPGGSPNPRSDFGFAMGHWHEKLIVGAPSSNFIGEVYSCPVAAVKDNTEILCSIMNFNQFFANNSTYSLELNPNQNFYLGASISTTKYYFLTCAPLVTKLIAKGDTTVLDAFGSCFMISTTGKAEPYKGLDSRFLTNSKEKQDMKKERMVGGYGWNTLADEVNGFLITAKTSVSGDINYKKITQPFQLPTSLSKKYKTSFEQENYLNIGYGLAAGTFFSSETVYAFSVQTSNVKGQILFLKPEDNELALMSNKITNRVVGAMFAYTLAAADLNLDGLAELLVGAPAQSDDGAEIEHGALHIYLGGDIESCNDKSRMRTIFGEAGGGRFGTAVAASDIDGDNIPEIFVSAPYENTGQVYILSGFELNKTLISSATFAQIRVSELKLNQKVQRSDLRLLGYSLQLVPDLDDNGCDDLAIGAPGAASVLLSRCLQHVNITISSHVIGSQYVREKDDNFTVNVCLQFSYRSNSSDVTGNVIALNDIKHTGAYIPESNFTVDLSEKPDNFCKPITVKLTKYESTVYYLTTKLNLHSINSSLESKHFNKSWVVLSPYSETENKLRIERRCDGEDCKPKLSMEIMWRGPKSYSIGSSEVEAVTIQVTNEGFAAQSACVRVDMTGARVSIGINKRPAGGYEYLLPNPLSRNITHSVEIVLKMTELSNMDTGLEFTARLYENCDQDKSFTTDSLKIPYSLEQQKELVRLEGNVHHLQLTDKDIYDKRDVPLKDSHEYSITNNGSITWNGVRASIVVKKKPFIKGVGTTETHCESFDDDQQFRINFILTLPAGATNKIIIWVEMSKEDIGEYLNKGQQIDETSEMILHLDPTDYYLRKELVTTIKWDTDMTFASNKLLIGLIAGLLAVLILALIYYILLKKGFFKRNQKKQLNDLRETVIKRRNRVASESRQSRHTASSSAANEDHVDIEVMEDSAFEEIPGTSNDDVVLIESKAEVHSQDQPKAIH